MASEPRLLVPLDGSAFAETALPTALGVARTMGVGVELVSVIYELDLIRVQDLPLPSADPAASAEGLEQEVRDYHDTLIDRIRQVTTVPVSSTILHGPVAQKLEGYVGESTPDLVVMSTHGRGTLSRAWLGSVADRLVRHVQVPVLLVRPVEGEETTLGDTHAFTSMVIALDGSTRAEQPIPLALRIGKPSGARVSLVRVVPMPSGMQSVYLPDASAAVHEALERGQKDATAYLDAIAKRLADQGVAVTSAVATGRAPAQGILDHADDVSADLIVIATHGRSGVVRALLGSVADKVLRAADAAVLIVRPSDGK